MKSLFTIVAVTLLLTQSGVATPADAPRSVDRSKGNYFAKKVYTPHPLPQFADLRDRLPSPIYDARPEWVAMYWKAWELAFDNFHEPTPGSHFVSQFIDAAYNKDIFLWDTCFMSMFCNVAYSLVPGIQSLDNFYARQYRDGEICREIRRQFGTDKWPNYNGWSLYSRSGWIGHKVHPDARVIYLGRPVPEPPPHLTLDGLDNPLPAWAELESLLVTGDRTRVAEVYPALTHYYQALRKYLRQGNGLYVTDWASMDNSPRNSYLANGGTAVDTSCQMVLFARNLATMARLLDKPNDARTFTHEAARLSAIINHLMWDPQRKFYFDLTLHGKRAPVETVAAFWALLANVASPAQAKDLVAQLNNKKTFAPPSGCRPWPQTNRVSIQTAAIGGDRCGHQPP